MRIPFSKYKINGVRLTKVTGTKAYNKAYGKDRDCPTVRTKRDVEKEAERYAKIHGEYPLNYDPAPGLKIPFSAQSGALASHNVKKASFKELIFWSKEMPVIDLPGLGMGALRIDDPAIVGHFKNADIEALTQDMQYARAQKSVPVFYGKGEQAGLSDLLYHVIGRDQFVRLDLALLFMLAGEDQGTAFAHAVVVCDPSTIDVAFRVITKMKPLISADDLKTVLHIISGVAGHFDLEHLLSRKVTQEEAKSTFGWFNTCDLLRKGASMVSVHVQSMSPDTLATFDAHVKSCFSASDIDSSKMLGNAAGAHDPSTIVSTQTPDQEARKATVADRNEAILIARKDAMRAGMLVAGALDAACVIKSRDEATLSSLKNAIGGIVGGACGAALIAGAVAAPLATAAINAAFDAAWVSRDFKKAAHCLRAQLEVTKLNAGDLSAAMGSSDADANRYFQWINATVHAMGYA